MVHAEVLEVGRKSNKLVRWPDAEVGDRGGKKGYSEIGIIGKDEEVGGRGRQEGECSFVGDSEASRSIVLKVLTVFAPVLN